MSDSKAGLISLATASVLVGLSPRRIQQLQQQGFIPAPVKRGQYALVGLVQGVLHYYRDENRNATKTAAASRKDDARTRLLDLEVAEREHRLIDIDEALAVVDEIMATCRTAMESIAPRVTSDLVLRDKIDTVVDVALGKMSSAFDRRAGELRKNGEVSP